MACANCSQPIAQVYFEVNQKTLCESCSGRIQAWLHEGVKLAHIVKAFGAGLVAAIAGSVLWYVVIKVWNFELGILAIAVGFLVGKAVRWGSGGHGGWLFQILAILLTYGSIVSSYVPLIAAEASKPDDTPVAAAAGTDSSTTAAGEERTPATGQAAASDSQGGRSLGWWIMIVIVSFAAPFLMGFSNILGLAIIGIALYEAWAFNRKTKIAVNGPYQVGAAASPPAGG